MVARSRCRSLPKPVQDLVPLRRPEAVERQDRHAANARVPACSDKPVGVRASTHQLENSLQLLAVADGPNPKAIALARLDALSAVSTLSHVPLLSRLTSRRTRCRNSGPGAGPRT